MLLLVVTSGCRKYAEPKWVLFTIGFSDVFGRTSERGLIVQAVSGYG